MARCALGEPKGSSTVPISWQERVAQNRLAANLRYQHLALLGTYGRPLGVRDAFWNWFVSSP